MKKRKFEKVKILYVLFLIVLFIELLGAIGAILFSDTAAIREAGITNTFLIILTAIVVLIPWLVESRYKIDIPDYLEVILLTLLFVGIVLGYLYNYYVDVKGFDKLTHTLSGITLSIIAFQGLYVFNQSEKINFKATPKVIAIFAFTLSVTLLVIWEFYEFSIDTISFNLNADTLRNMQRYQWVNTSTIFPQPYGLYDTMMDLIVGTIGALVVSIIGYFLIKNKEKKIRK